MLPFDFQAVPFPPLKVWPKYNSSRGCSWVHVFRDSLLTSGRRVDPRPRSEELETHHQIILMRGESAASNRCSASWLAQLAQIINPNHHPGRASAYTPHPTPSHITCLIVGLNQTLLINVINTLSHTCKPALQINKLKTKNSHSGVQAHEHVHKHKNEDTTDPFHTALNKGGGGWLRLQI